MSVNEGFVGAPILIPAFNIGGLRDVPTGRYYTGAKGESLLAGGLAPVTGYGGRGNAFKSTLAFYDQLTAMNRYGLSGQSYDTEESMQYGRWEDIMQTIAPEIQFMDEWVDQGRFIITKASKYNGSEWLSLLRKVTKETSKEASANVVTPFLDREGKPIKVLRPYVVSIDSLSGFSTGNIEELREKQSLGSGSRNTEDARAAGGRSQLINELPVFCARNGVNAILTVHMGDNIQLDPHAPPSKKLASMKNNIKFKRVPENFTFLTNNCWLVENKGPGSLLQDDKTPTYPKDKADRVEGTPDLQLLSLTSLRCKTGMTNYTMPLVVSQSMGLLPHLSEYHFLKTNSYWGFNGHPTNHQLSIYPELNLGRTTIREKIDSDPLLCRALTITAELLQIHQTMKNRLPAEYFCTASELYESLKTQGYDWKVLLQTRGYWTYDQYDNPIPYLSTLDLLKMRQGIYRPYWMN